MTQTKPEPATFKGLTYPANNDTRSVAISKFEDIEHLTEITCEPPKGLRTDEIHTLRSVFQPREIYTEYAENLQHVEDLKDAITTSPKGKRYNLDPLDVILIGERWYLINGHHRLAAYKALDITREVPVTAFKGNAEEAYLLSISSNQKVTLNMSKADRCNAAWGMALTGRFSKAQIAAKAQVSRSVVGNMRKTMNVLMSTKSGLAAIKQLSLLESLSWEAASQLEKGNDRTEFGDEALKAAIQARLRDLGKFVKPGELGHPTVLALAFISYSEQGARFLATQILQELGEAPEGDSLLD